MQYMAVPKLVQSQAPVNVDTDDGRHEVLVPFVLISSGIISWLQLTGPSIVTGYPKCAAPSMASSRVLQVLSLPPVQQEEFDVPFLQST